MTRNFERERQRSLARQAPFDSDATGTAIRKRLEECLSDLDAMGCTLAAAHLSQAISALEAVEWIDD